MYSKQCSECVFCRSDLQSVGLALDIPDDLHAIALQRRISDCLLNLPKFTELQYILAASLEVWHS